jgi:hypothetical protein
VLVTSVYTGRVSQRGADVPSLHDTHCAHVSQGGVGVYAPPLPLRCTLHMDLRRASQGRVPPCTIHAPHTRRVSQRGVVAYTRIPSLQYCLFTPALLWQSRGKCLTGRGVWVGACTGCWRWRWSPCCRSAPTWCTALLWTRAERESRVAVYSL